MTPAAHTGRRHEPGTSNTRPASQSSSERLPSPCYGGDRYGAMDLHHRNFGTDARVADDGRVDINIQERGRRLSDLVAPVAHAAEAKTPRKPWIPPSPAGKEAIGPIPRLNVVIHVVGSMGDVRPFIAFGRALKERFGHRIRLATHSKFRDLVESNGLEFFCIGSDPADLMAFMVRNPGLMPGIDSLRSGDVGKRRKDITEIISGCWRSCFESGDGTGPAVSDIELPGRCRCDDQPFIADVIVANPPSFAHCHCAEKLGIPLHLMFTMPWSPTTAFSHPLANIRVSNTETGVANFLSYPLVEMLTWQGLGDIINRFRERSLGLEPISVVWAPGIIPRLRIPFTYCWSPALLPKPRDWDDNIDISGFFFLSSESDYRPPEDLVAFLESGPPPVYIGFGSIVVDQPDVMTKMIFEAVEKTGQRAIISHGWGGLSAGEIGPPKDVFMIGSCPHDWLFPQVSCVVHHGGAGTTAIGISCRKPTVIVPFFGDQPFWGSVVSKAGAGPPPIPHKRLTADKLATAIQQALEPETLQKAEELGGKINKGNGLDAGVQSFHRQLRVDSVRCMMSRSRPAVWRVRRTKIRLSAFAATALSNEGILDLHNLKLYRSREYDLEPGPRDPVTGGAAALLGSIADFTMGIADLPAELLQALPIPQSSHKHGKHGKHEESSTSSGRTSESRSSTPTDGYVAPPDRSGTPVESDTESNVAETEGVERHAFSKRKAKGLGKLTGKEIIAAGEAASRIVAAGLKSPMELAVGIARGFHNAPKLYHDESVREMQKISGLQSGLKAAGKEFGYGFYDGISGLVTQPIRGRREGAAGVLKGIGKGIGGLILKPGAGVFALTGYTLNGIYKEVQKIFGASVECYIVACRSKQGYDEWNESTKEERDEVITRWYTLGSELESKAMKTRFAKDWDMATRVLLHPHDKHEHPHDRHHPTPTTHCAPETPSGEDEIGQRKSQEALNKASRLLSDLIYLFNADSAKSAVDEDEPTVEEIARIKSTGLPTDDAMLGKALRESIAEMRKAEAGGDSANAYPRAIQAGTEAARRMNWEGAAPSGGGVPSPPRSSSPERRARGDQKEAEEDRESVVEAEVDRLSEEGIDDVTEFAIWKTLTEQRRESGGAEGGQMPEPSS